MDATLTLDEIDRHVSAIFDINVAATHCIRLVCEDCAGLSILPVPGPGGDEDRPWLCPVCTSGMGPRSRWDPARPRLMGERARSRGADAGE
jgi:hypothetical protein